MQEINKAKRESRLHSILKIMKSKASWGSPKLIVLCGPSHAGKSMFAQRLRRHYRVISSDEIRREFAGCFGRPKVEAKVWKVFDAMKRQALKEGDNVMLDACHMSERARWHALQGPNERHRKICVVFDLPFRAIREGCLAEKRVCLDDVKRMWKAFQHSKPSLKELKLQGFDDVYFIRGDSVRAMQFTRRHRKVYETKSVYKAFCHKAGQFLIAAASILLRAPTDMCMRARAVYVSGGAVAILGTFGLCGANHYERLPRHLQAGVLYAPSSSRRVVGLVRSSIVR